MHNLLQVVEWLNQKFLGPSLQVYGLATPLTIIKIVPLPSALSEEMLLNRRASLWVK